MVLAILALALGGREPSGPVEPPAPALVGVTVEVAHSPACECCTQWAADLRKRGATVAVTHVDDFVAVKASAGIPDELVS